MRKGFHSVGRGYTSYALISRCTYFQNELNKKFLHPFALALHPGTKCLVASSAYRRVGRFAAIEAFFLL